MGKGEGERGRGGEGKRGQENKTQRTLMFLFVRFRALNPLNNPFRAFPMRLKGGGRFARPLAENKGKVIRLAKGRGACGTKYMIKANLYFASSMLTKCTIPGTFQSHLELLLP